MKRGARMLRRLISWCVPNSALELRAPEAEMTDIESVLAPYRDEPPPRRLRLAEPVREWPRALG